MSPVVVSSVCGPVLSTDLGMVLPHEHLICDITPSYSPSGVEEIDRLLAGPVNAKLSWVLGQYPYNSRDNCVMDDIDGVLEELIGFASVGGGTVIDLTTANEGRSLAGLQDMSRRSGVKVIMGAGWYLESTENERVRTASIDELVAELLDDFRNPDTRPGVIGEIGVSPGFTEAEHRTLRAAAEAQRQLRVPLFIHLPGWQRHGHEVLDIVLGQAEVDAGSVVLCHVDPSGDDADYQRSLADRGVYLEFDMIGMPYFYRGWGEGQSPSPEATAHAVTGLIEHGLLDQILISHDMGIKSMMSKNGGNGLRYVPTMFVERLIRLGCPDDVRSRLMQDNPRRLFETAGATAEAVARE